MGHQIVAHRAPGAGVRAHHPVDGHDMPVPHFGVILEWDVFHTLAERLMQAGVEFVIAPYIRFAGHVGELATMFFRDPSGNSLEFKSFRDFGQIFAS